MSNHYNFQLDSEKEKCKYKLWVLYKPPFCFKLKKNPYPYFGFYKKRDQGYSMLVKLAEDRAHMYYLAILYDNQATDKDNDEIRRWESENIPEHVKKKIEKHNNGIG